MLQFPCSSSVPVMKQVGQNQLMEENFPSNIRSIMERFQGRNSRRSLKKLWKKHCFLVCSLAGLSIAIFLTYPRTICHGMFPISVGSALLYQQNNPPTHMAAGPSALGIPSTETPFPGDSRWHWQLKINRTGAQRHAGCGHADTGRLRHELVQTDSYDVLVSFDMDPATMCDRHWIFHISQPKPLVKFVYYILEILHQIPAGFSLRKANSHYFLKDWRTKEKSSRNKIPSEGAMQATQGEIQSTQQVQSSCNAYK